MAEQPLTADAFAPLHKTQEIHGISRPSLSYWQDAWIRLKANRRALFSLYLVIGLLLFTFLGPVFWQVDPAKQDVDQISQPPLADRSVTLVAEYAPWYGEEADPGEGLRFVAPPTTQHIRIAWDAIPGADGGYLATRLSPGTYFVDVDGSTLPAGLTLSAGSSDPTSTRTITAEETFLDLDIGYTTSDSSTAIIGDYVWSDADGDGLQDPGEPGLGGVTVQLLDSGGAVIATTTTDADGRYRFTGVAAGEYQVQIPASNFTGGQPLDGFTATAGPQSQGGTLSAPVLVAAGDIELQVDFGFDGTTFDITDAVWVDIDGEVHRLVGAAVGMNAAIQKRARNQNLSCAVKEAEKGFVRAMTVASGDRQAVQVARSVGVVLPGPHGAGPASGVIGQKVELSRCGVPEPKGFEVVSLPGS